MRNSQRVKGHSPLNAALENYPNVFFALHEGVTGTPASQATVADQNTSNGWEMTVDTVGATQWNTTTGAWEPEAANSDQSLSLARTVDPTTFDSIFDVAGKASLFCVLLDHVADPTTVGRIFSIDGNATNPTVEVKYLTNGTIQFLLGDAAQATVLALNAAGESQMLLFVYVDDRADGLKQIVPKIYTPNSKTILETTTPLTTVGATIQPIESTSHFMIGASRQGGVPATFADDVGIRRVRVINFDQSPPSDMDELIEELAVTNLLATSR